MKAKFTISVTISEERDPEIFDWIRRQDGSMQNIIRELLRQQASGRRTELDHKTTVSRQVETPTTQTVPGVPVSSFGVPGPEKPASHGHSGFVNKMLDNG